MVVLEPKLEILTFEEAAIGFSNCSNFSLSKFSEYFEDGGNLSVEEPMKSSMILFSKFEPGSVETNEDVVKVGFCFFRSCANNSCELTL